MAIQFSSLEQARSVATNGVSSPAAKKAAQDYIMANTQGGNYFPASPSAPDNGAIQSGGGTYAAAAPAGPSPEESAARLQIDQGINQANDAMGRLNGQQTTAINNLNNDYNSAYNRLLGNQAAANQQYTTNTNNQVQDYVNSRANISSNMRNLATSAQRLLGSQGAGGGSAERFTVPNAAQLVGSNQNARVQQTNQRNLAALTAGHNEDERNFKNSFADLSSQLDKNTRATQSQYEQQRADLLNTIATLTGQKAILNGQNYQQALAATQPFTSRIGGILNTIDRLAANPSTIREQAVTLAQPNLADYAYDRFTTPTANASAPQDPTLSAIAALLGGEDQKKQQQLA